MDREKHARLLGALVANLQSLEVALRAALHKHSGGDDSWDLDDLKLGDTVPEGPFVRWGYFGNLARDFNAIAKLEDRVSEDLILLRNALAHGVVTSKTAGLPMRLVKFGKPANGRVPVEMVAVMGAEWFGRWVKLTRDAAKRVAAYSFNDLQNGQSEPGR